MMALLSIADVAAVMDTAMAPSSTPRACGLYVDDIFLVHDFDVDERQACQEADAFLCRAICLPWLYEHFFPQPKFLFFSCPLPFSLPRASLLTWKQEEERIF